MFGRVRQNITDVYSVWCYMPLELLYGFLSGSTDEEKFSRLRDNLKSAASSASWETIMGAAPVMLGFSFFGMIGAAVTWFFSRFWLSFAQESRRTRQEMEQESRILDKINEAKISVLSSMKTDNDSVFPWSDAGLC